MRSYLETNFDLSDPQIASIIDDLPLWSAPFGLKLLDTVEYRNNLIALDIGSGAGFPLIELSQRLGNSCRLFGIDPWIEAVERAKLKIRRWDVLNTEILLCKAENLPFEDNYFDLIISNNGINNVENDELTMSELSRVSKSGAQMVLTTNLPDTMKEFYEVFEKVLRETGKIFEIEKLKQHRFKKRKPISYMRELIEKHGFQIKNISTDSFDLRFTDGSTMLNHFFIKLAFIGSWKTILQDSDVRTVFKLIEKELNEKSQIEGMLNLSIPYACFNCRKQN